MKQRKDYTTRQRDAVLDCFASQPQRGMTAQTVYELLRSEGVTIGRTTVFRTIARLCKSGRLIVLSDLRSASGSPRAYQHAAQSSHISIRCSGCGQMAALTCESMKQFEQHLFADHGFLLQQEECILNGLCGKCLDRRENSQDKENV